MTTPNTTTIQQFFAQLYPDVGDGYLILSWPSPTRKHKDGQPALDNSWHNLATTGLDRIATRAATLAAEHSVYFGVALQHPSRQPNPFERSRNSSAYVLPGLYFDMDLAYGNHAASALPGADADALAFLAGLPAKPSLIIHTGGGLHAYWLFETPIFLTAEQDRTTMTQVLKEFAYTLCQAGKERGWQLDALRDLARVLRPPGIGNRKYNKNVQILQASDVRYTLADFDWLTPLPAPSVHHGEGTGVQDQPDLGAVIEAYGGTLTQKSEHEWHGPHPQHGSSTGVNFDVNTTKHLWHCWRHGTGGDALSLIAVCEGLVTCEDLQPGVLGGPLFPQVLAIATTRFGWTAPATPVAPHPDHTLTPSRGDHAEENVMSLPVTLTTELDGTLRYECGQDIAVRVQLHRATGRKKYPVEVLYQGTSVLATDANLRELRDIETLNKHALALCNAAPWHEVLTAIAKELPEKAQAPWTPVSKPLATYQMERKEYLWYPTIPKGEPVSLEGDPGTGKSALLVKLMCHLTTGQRFPTLFADRPEQDFPPRHVLLFTYEDDPHSTIHPRVAINGGDPRLVQFVEGKRDPETGEVRPTTLQDLTILETLLKTYTPALMAFDPLQSFFGDHADMNNAADTRPILDAIRNLCKSYGCTPLYVRHNGKTQRSKAMHSALGSVDITANMRSALALYKDPDDETKRILAQTKTNGRYAPSMQLKLVGATHDAWINAHTVVTVEDVRVDWDGKSDLTADDLNARECAHGNDPTEAQSAIDQAREFLRELLQNGPILVDDLKAQAKQAGVTWSTLRRAKDKEKVQARREEQDGVPFTKWPWVWELPGAGNMST